jgi:hypothetical protein
MPRPRPAARCRRPGRERRHAGRHGHPGDGVCRQGGTGHRHPDGAVADRRRGAHAWTRWPTCKATRPDARQHRLHRGQQVGAERWSVDAAPRPAMQGLLARRRAVWRRAVAAARPPRPHRHRPDRHRRQDLAT